MRYCKEKIFGEIINSALHGIAIPHENASILHEKGLNKNRRKK